MNQENDTPTFYKKSIFINMDLVSLFSEGARQYPPHPMEHAAMESKKHTINITIGFPFQHQQVYHFHRKCQFLVFRLMILYIMPFRKLNDHDVFIIKNDYIF